MSAGKSVSVRNLTIRFGSFTAVDDISFDVEKGEIFGFLGANGAGKTTTIRALCGLLTPTAGELLVAGFSPADGLDNLKRKTGYMSQKFTLYPDLTVGENMDFSASLRKMPPDLLKKRKKELFDFIGLSVKEGTLVRSLPGGIKQQLSLAAAMLGDPEIVFLDEPTAGVSPSARLKFWELIRRTAAAGKTVFVTTHYMDEAEQCGRVALMQAGKIAALDSPAALKKRFFPEPLYEVEADDPAAFLAAAEKAGCAELAPYGMRYHAVVSDDDAWKGLMSSFGAGVSARPVAPSLEDVFIRVIGGGHGTL